jgi:hypothetical protein
MEDAFADRVGKFVVACMNKRVNGTIFLGVVDGKEEGSKTHGTIAGVPLDRLRNEHLVAEWMDKYFRAKDPVLFYNTTPFFKQAIRSQFFSSKPNGSFFFQTSNIKN